MATFILSPDLVFNVATTYDLDQDAFRFYEDGTESGATPRAAENTDITLDLSGGDAIVLYRVRIQASGGAASPGSSTMEWFAAINGGSFNTLNSQSSRFTFPGTQLSDGSTTTQQLSAGSGTFETVGEQEESQSLIIATKPGANSHCEHILGVNFVATGFSNNDTVDLRLTSNASVDSQTYSQIGRVTISK